MLSARPKIRFPGIIKGERIVRLSHDFETYSREDVTDIGADAYSLHPTTEVLMCAYSFDMGKTMHQWVPAEGEKLPTKLEDAVRDERVVKTCWNKGFEWSIWHNTLDITTPHSAWRDTQALAYSLALPGSLEKAGEVVDLAEDKKKSAAGRALMRLFSSPRKPTKNKPWRRTFWHMEPKKWDEYKDYNRQDVVAECAILRKLIKFDMPEHEWELWVIDQIINQAGIPFNMKAVDRAVELFDHIQSDRLADMKRITGLDNPNSGAQLLPWLQDHGYRFEDLKKGHVSRAIEKTAETIDENKPLLIEANDERDTALIVPVDDQKKLVSVLKLRQDAARASPKKYFAIQRCVDRFDAVLRNTFQFAGAGRTWRWAGRIFQPQNLPRPEKAFKKIIDMAVADLEKMTAEAIDLIYDDPMKLLVSCIRAVAQAPDGYLFCDADLNAIENRVLGWIAHDKKILRVFELKRDPYVDFATYMFHQPYDVLYAEYKAGDDAKRTIAKPGVLGCGYQLGVGREFFNNKTGEWEATGLLGYAKNMGITLTAEQAKLAVDTFRATFEAVVDFWKDIEKAAKKCIRTGLPTSINMIRFEMKPPFLLMVLPSGRALHYCRPRIEATETPWGEMRDQMTYEGLNDRNQWVRIATHGGKLTENADQAIARDVLAHGLRLAYYRGLDIRIHVHDQVVTLAPEKQADKYLDVLQECMADEPKWAIGLPLGSAGFVSKVFKKD